jgi:hypothetical protein
MASPVDPGAAIIVTPTRAFNARPVVGYRTAASGGVKEPVNWFTKESRLADFPVTAECHAATAGTSVATIGNSGNSEPMMSARLRL